MIGNDWKTTDASSIFYPSAGDAMTNQPTAAQSGNRADLDRDVTVVASNMEVRPLKFSEEHN